MFGLQLELLHNLFISKTTERGTLGQVLTMDTVLTVFDQLHWDMENVHRDIFIKPWTFEISFSLLCRHVCRIPLNNSMHTFSS